jgi:rod shape-determining protein MreC
MRRHLLLAAALVPLSLLLLAVPPDALASVRLRIRSLLPVPRPATPAPPGEERRTDALDPDRPALEERLLQQSAEITRLRTRLRNLTDVRGRYPALQFHTATVVLFDPRRETVTIDRGAADGLARGSGVLQGLALAGTVAHLAPGAAEVRLLTHPRSFVPARVAETGEICAVAGRGDGAARAVFYGTGTRARRGQHVLTSGLVGALPADLVVGTLAEDPAEGEEANTQRAALRLRLDPATLADVVVVQRAAEETATAGDADAAE